MTKPTFSAVLEHPAASPAEAERHFRDRMAFETDASDLHGDLEKGVEGIVVVDARSPESFAKGHIPGALNLPHRRINEETTAHLSREATLVTYCDGPGCNASTRAAIRLAALGFRVKEMPGGIEWWEKDGYTLER